MNIELVSIIIPVFNSKKFIVHAIDSCLNQTYQNIEVIVIDDGSNDGSFEIINNNYSSNNRVKLLTHENRVNKGVYSTRKLGISHSRGKYIAFLDSDDWFNNNKISLQVDVFEKNQDVVLVHSSVNFHNDSINNDFYNDFKFSNTNIKYNVDLKTFIKNNHICNSSVMVKKEIFEKIILPNNLAYQYEDWICWILMSKYGCFYYLNEKICNYRYHLDSSTAFLIKKKSISLYSNFEKNLVLSTLLQNKIIKEELYNSIDEINIHLFKNQKMSLKFYFYGFLNSVIKKINN